MRHPLEVVLFQNEEGGTIGSAALARLLAEKDLNLVSQGGLLHQDKINIGGVAGIVGVNWWDVTIDGFANHAGTTPMNQRKDALLAAAKYIDAVNRVVASIPGRQVGTVGKLQAFPGA